MPEITSQNGSTELGTLLTGIWRAWEWLTRPVRYPAVRRLHSAAAAGDVEMLRTLLAPSVAVVVDSGQRDPVCVRVIRGPRDVARVLAHSLAPQPDVVVQERSVNSQAGLMISRAGRPSASIAVDFSGRLVSMIWVRLDPAARRHWNTVYA